MTELAREDYFDFDNLLPELRIEVVKQLDIQSLGRFIQTNRNAEKEITRDVWRRRIIELDPTIWEQLTKRTRKGDLKLLCAIVQEGSITWCKCCKSHLTGGLPITWRDFLLFLQASFSVPAQNAFLCYLLTFAKHGSVTPVLLRKHVGMKCGDVYLTHRRIVPWLRSVASRIFMKTAYSYRVFLHQFARATFCWSVRWRMDPLLINNQEAFLSIKLYDENNNLVEFSPNMRHRSSRNSRHSKIGPLKIDSHNTKFYTIEQIRKNKFKCVLDGVEISPIDLYYFFDNACIDDLTCPRSAAMPQVIKSWLLDKRQRSLNNFD
jgi:hypothetical protein